jgi:hypothetical protein
VYQLEEDIKENPENIMLLKKRQKLLEKLAPFGGALFLRDETAINGEALRGALNVAISQALQSAVVKASGTGIDLSGNPIITDFKTFDGIEVNGVVNAPDTAKMLYDVEDAVF